MAEALAMQSYRPSCWSRFQSRHQAAVAVVAVQKSSFQFWTRRLLFRQTVVR